jgi:hypothetical protein
MRSFFFAVATLIAAASAAPLARAADRQIYSYDAVSVQARQMTGAGLTFTFRKNFFSTRIEQVRATGVPVGVFVKPESDGSVGKALQAAIGPKDDPGAIYAIDAKKAQGPVMIAAFCPGSTRAWLAVGPLEHGQDLRLYALGDNPTTGVPRLCATMDFTWRGEWKLRDPTPRDTLGPQFKDDYGRPGT